MVIGLTVDVPRDGPDLGIDVLEQAGLAPLVFEEGAGEGERALTGTKKVAREGRQVVGPGRGRRQGRCSGCGGWYGVVCPRCVRPQGTLGDRSR